MSDPLPPMPPEDPPPSLEGPRHLPLDEVPFPEPPVAKKRTRILALLLALGLIMVATGTTAAFFAMSGSGEQLMEQVPAGVDIVLTAYLDPAASQKVNLFRMAGRFAGADPDTQLLGQWNEFLDQVLASAGLNHNDLGWVGSQVAFEANLQPGGLPSAAFLIDATDVDAASRTLQTVRESPAAGGSAWHDSEYKGVTVSSSAPSRARLEGALAYAIAEDTVVLGSSTQAVDAVIDTQQGGASMQDSSDFQATLQGLPEGRLAMAYLRPGDVLAAIRQQLPVGEGLPGALFQSDGPSTIDAVRGVGMTLAAEPDGVALDVNVAYDSARLPAEVRAQMDAPPTPNTLTALVPANAYGVMLQQHVGDSLKAALAQLDTRAPQVARGLEDAGISGAGGLLDSLTGDMAIALLPGASVAPVNGALVLGSTDARKMQAVLDHIRALAEIPGAWKTEDYRGTTVTYLARTGAGDPAPAYAVVDGAGVLATSLDPVEAVIDAQANDANISSSIAYTDAIAKVPTASGVLFLDVRGLIAGIGSALPSDARTALDQQLGSVTAVVAGSETDASHQHTRLLIEIP